MEWSGQASYMQSHQLPAQLIPAMLGVGAIDRGGRSAVLASWLESPGCSIHHVPLFGDGERAVAQLWALHGASAGGMQTQFLKSVGVMGGLLMIAASGPGKWSLDR